jgi:predicted TIM-barrel fold metal-dependent hydrolase
MLIDAWIQHPTTEFMRHPMFASLLRWRGIDPALLPETIPSAFTLGALDAAKVDRALVSAWWGPSGPLLSNDHVAALVRAHPERFVGVASVDLLRPMDGVRELRRAVKTLGLRALRMLPWLYNLPPNDRRYYRSTPSASSWGSRSVFRSVTPGRSRPPSRDAPSRISTKSRSSFPSS